MTAPLDERGLPVGYPFRSELELTPRQVKAGLEAGSLVLVDCRTPGEWATARIQGATLIPLDELAARAAEVDALAADEAMVVAVHCHHGARSMKAALFLRQRGIGAMSMAGGIDLWSVDVDPAVRRY